MSKERKKLQKKKARQKAVKKRLIETRLEDRKQRKLERLRDEAFEREFAKKQNLGLSSEEIKERLENNLKILQALEDEFLRESPEKAATAAQIKEQLDIQQEYLKKAQEEKNSENTV